MLGVSLKPRTIFSRAASTSSSISIVFILVNSVYRIYRVCRMLCSRDAPFMAV